MTALPFVPSGADPIPGKGAESMSAGAIPATLDLAHWVHGKRLRLCLTPSADGLIGVYIAVPAAALPVPARYGVHVNASDDHATRFFAPDDLSINHTDCILRGSRQACADFCPGYRVGFELDLEPGMVEGVAAALRSCIAISRRITLESGPCSSAI